MFNLFLSLVGVDKIGVLKLLILSLYLYIFFVVAAFLFLDLHQYLFFFYNFSIYSIACFYFCSYPIIAVMFLNSEKTTSFDY